MSFGDSSRSARAILCGIALVLATGASARGQESEPSQKSASNSEIESVLNARNRATLHPGNPLEIVGLEQGTNDLRSRTPALVSSNRAAVLLNSDELHERTLAMYESGAHFSQPATAQPAEKATPKRSLIRRVLAPVDVADNPLGWGRWLVLLGLVTMLAGIGRAVWMRLKSEAAGELIA